MQFDLDIKNPNKKEQQQEFSSAELIKMLTDSFDETKKILAEIKEGLWVVGKKQKSESFYLKERAW